MDLSAISYYTQRLASSIKGLRHIHGHGIHSPFVFDLITNVIENPHSYYALKDLELLRKRMEQQSSFADLLKQESLSKKDGELLFRLNNRYKPKSLLIINEASGLISLYASAYASLLKVASMPTDSASADSIRAIHSQHNKNKIELLFGNIEESLSSVFSNSRQIDFIFFNLSFEQNRGDSLFSAYIERKHDKSIFVINGIRRDYHQYREWKKMAAHPDVTVAVELCRMGILFFDKKLHKRTYTLYY